MPCSPPEDSCSRSLRRPRRRGSRTKSRRPAHPLPMAKQKKVTPKVAHRRQQPLEEQSVANAPPMAQTTNGKIAPDAQTPSHVQCQTCLLKGRTWCHCHCKDWPSDVSTDFVTPQARQQPQPSPSQLRTFYELKYAYSDLPFSAFSAVCIARGIPFPSSVP